MDSQRSRLVVLGASLLGAAVVGFVIYRRFFSTKRIKSSKHGESSQDEVVTDESHEISPPADFKSDHDLRYQSGDIVTVVEKAPVVQPNEELEVVEEIIVPAAIDNVEFSAPRNLNYGEVPTTSNAVSEFTKLDDHESDAEEVLEFSPPADFKTCNSVAEDDELLDRIEKDLYPNGKEPPCEIVEEVIAPSTAGASASAPLHTWNNESDDDVTFSSFVPINSEPSHPNTVTSTDNCSMTDSVEPFHPNTATSPDNSSMTDSVESTPSATNKSESDASPVMELPPSSTKVLPLEEISAEVEKFEQNFDSLSKLGFAESANGTEEFTSHLNISRVSDDSSVNGCSSVTDSGVGSTVVNDGEKILETNSVSSVISSDNTDAVRSAKESAADFKFASKDIRVGVSTKMADTNGTVVEAVSSAPKKHQQTPSSDSKPTHKSAREPANNSSPSMRIVREFYMPESLCGRFIGKGGRNISALKHETNTNIKVGRELVLPGNKCCSVEGPQDNVERALRLIQKQYPEVDVSGAVPPAMVTLSANMMQLNLPVGVMLDAVISHIESAGHVFVQQPTHPTFSSWQISDLTMNASYADGSGAPPLPATVEDGTLCVASINGHWQRAQIMGVAEDGLNCDVKLMDVGGYASVERSMIRQIRADFLQLPFQASECYLANVAPLEGDLYSVEAAEHVRLLTCNQVVQCQSVALSDNNNIPYIHVIAHHNHQAVVVNRDLADKRLVTWYDM